MWVHSTLWLNHILLYIHTFFIHHLLLAHRLHHNSSAITNYSVINMARLVSLQFAHFNSFRIYWELYTLKYQLDQLVALVLVFGGSPQCFPYGYINLISINSEESFLFTYILNFHQHLLDFVFLRTEMVCFFFSWYLELNPVSSLSYSTSQLSFLIWDMVWLIH